MEPGALRVAARLKLRNAAHNLARDGWVVLPARDAELGERFRTAAVPGLYVAGVPLALAYYPLAPAGARRAPRLLLSRALLEAGEPGIQNAVAERLEALATAGPLSPGTWLLARRGANLFYLAA